MTVISDKEFGKRIRALLLTLPEYALDMVPGPTPQHETQLDAITRCLKERVEAIDYARANMPPEAFVNHPGEPYTLPPNTDTYAPPGDPNAPISNPSFQVVLSDKTTEEPTNG